jgi:HK97 family phage prohead protease
MPRDTRIPTGPFDLSGRPASVPARASEPGADHDFTGDRGRIIVPTQAQLPELADAPGSAEMFDPATMSGRVTAYPSVIGRAYRMGWFTWHHLEAGCFDESIAEQGGRFPVYVQHNWDWSERPPIGHALEASEIDLPGADDGARALEVVAQLYPDVPDGLACLHATVGGALREWSIGYLIEAYRVEEDDEEGRLTVFIERAQLWEASLVLRGANPWTQTLDVAAAQPAQPAGVAEAVAELVRAGLADVDAGHGARLEQLVADLVDKRLAGQQPSNEPPMPPASADTDAWELELFASSPSFRAATAAGR